MDWITIITALVSALAGGGLIGLLTIRETKKGLKVDNQIKEDARWAQLADELQDEVSKLNDTMERKDARITELEDTVSELRTTLDATRTKCAVAEILRCETVSCSSRVPPLGVRNLNIDKLIDTNIED